MKYFLEAFQRYAQFSGRSERRAFWYFFLFNLLISYGIMFLELALDLPNILGMIYALGSLIPYLAVSIRRMHDINKSGWFVIIPLYNLYLWAQEGDSGRNQYGPNPLGNDDEDEDMMEHLIAED